MKKLVFNCFFIFFAYFFFFVVQGQAKNNDEINTNWQALTKYIYIDRNSITKNKYSTSAWFKIYDSNEHRLYSIDETPIHFEIIKYEIDCKTDVLALIHIKSFDKNGNMLKDEENTYNVFSGHDGVINGNIYFNAICEQKKGE